MFQRIASFGGRRLRFCPRLILAFSVILPDSVVVVVVVVVVVIAVVVFIVLVAVTILLDTTYWMAYVEAYVTSLALIKHHSSICFHLFPPDVQPFLSQKPQQNSSRSVFGRRS